MNEKLWRWFCAICAWDWGDPDPLAELVHSEPTPDEFRQAVTDILSGKRKRLRNWKKSKIPAAERMQAAQAVSFILQLVNAIKKGGGRPIEEIADQKCLEPIEVIRELEATARETKQKVADELGVSVETVENLVREMNARLLRWPVV